MYLSRLLTQAPLFPDIPTTESPLPGFTFILSILSMNLGAVPLCAKALWGHRRERAASFACEELRAKGVMAERCRLHSLHTVPGAQQTTHRPFPQAPRLQESKDMEKFTLTCELPGTR